MSIHDTSVSELGGSASNRRERPSGPHAPVLAQLSDAQRKRYEELLDWRRAEAARRGVGTHVVLANTLALRLVRAKLQSLQDLRREGLDERGVALYGRKLLALLGEP
jgi:ribonuclease D